MTTDPTAQPTPTPASAHRPTVLWQVDVLDEDIDLTDPVAVAVAAYEQIKTALWLPVLRVLLADGATFDVDLDARRKDAVTIVDPNIQPAIETALQKLRAVAPGFLLSWLDAAAALAASGRSPSDVLRIAQEAASGGDLASPPAPVAVPEGGTHYVAGFLFDLSAERVALVRKNRPEWQAGHLNGIGGHIEEGETASEAMRREFIEETGLDIDSWDHFATVQGEWGSVAFFRAWGDVSAVRTMEDEEILVLDVREALASDRRLPNLSWLLPLALYRHDDYQPVVADERSAPRLGPVTASDHHVPGAENFNALLDDVLANPEAREAFEAAQAEPVTAPLSSEAVDDEPPVGSVVLTYGREGTAWQRHVSDGLWHSTAGAVEAWSMVSTMGEIIRLLPPAADQRARDEGTMREEIAREIEAMTLRGPDNRLKHASSIRAIAARIARGGSR